MKHLYEVWIRVNGDITDEEYNIRNFKIIGENPIDICNILKENNYIDDFNEVVKLTLKETNILIF